MEKPICLITGATEGVGKATAAALAGRGFRVVLLARNQAKAEAVRTEIAASGGASDVDVLIGDLASLRQVRDAADAFKQRYARLDVLINNAGIVAPSRAVTADGYETTYQVNYLAHFLLTSHLLEPLRRSGRGRIINLSSSVYSSGKLDANNLQGEKKFSPIGAYAASKLMTLLFTIELAERLRVAGVAAYAVHPGIVRTHMLESAKGLFKLVAMLATPFAVAPARGAATSVHLATAPEADLAHASGQYFVKAKPVAVRTKFNTRAYREWLWRTSELQVQRLTGAGAVNLVATPAASP